MDFTLTNELLMLRKMYREFAENEIKPLAAEIDEEERFPKESIPKLARYGFLGIPFPKKYGGQGGTNLAYAMAIEELAKCCTTTATIVAAHTSLCCYPIYAYGTEEQKMKYLPDLLSGRKLGAFGLTALMPPVSRLWPFWRVTTTFSTAPSALSPTPPRQISSWCLP